MAINVNSLSPALREMVVKNGQVDIAKLQEIATSGVIDAKLKEEAGKLLQAELNGGTAFGDVGDKLETSTAKDTPKQEAAETKPGFFKRAGKYIADWWTDRDKVSTDGFDDGKISAGEKAEAFGKGVAGGVVKSVVKNPVESVAIIGGTAAAAYGATVGLTALGVAAAAPIVAGALVVAGLGFGAYAIYQGLKGAKEADTDGAAKAGYEEAGTGAAIVAMSALGARKISKSSVKASESAKPVEDVKPVEGVKPAEVAKPVEDVKPVENVKTAEAAKSVIPTTEEIEARYTRKYSFDSEHFERTISGESGSETEIFVNKRPDGSGYDRFSKMEAKYSDGRRIQLDMYDEYNHLAYTETYKYDSNGRLLEVVCKDHSSNISETVHSFVYNEKGILVKEMHPLERKVISYETSPYPESGSNKTKVITLNEMQRKATLDRAGLTEDVIAQINRENVSYGEGEKAATIRMVEYLENRLANGDKLTPNLIQEAIKECDGVYAEAGYGSRYQEEQLGLLLKYWNRADELRAAYRKEGWFVTQAERHAAEMAQRKATLDRAGLTEEVIAQINKENVSYGEGEKAATIRMVEYLENRLANGEKLSRQMVQDAIKECDGVYAQAGYGSRYQEEQLGIIAKYWTHGQELMDIYK